MTKIFIYEYIVAQGGDGEQLSLFPPSLLAEGRAMLDAVVADFRRLPGIEVMTVTGPDTQESYQALASQADWSLIIAPEFDGILEERCRWVVEAGGHLLGPTVEAVRLCSDKLAMAHHFQCQEISTPPTWPCEEAPANYPQVWKPRDGAGSQCTFLVRSRSDIATIEQTILEEGQSLETLIAQPYLTGIAASVAFLIGPQQCLAMLPCSQLLSDDGRFHYLGGECPLRGSYGYRAVELAGHAVQCVPGLAGYVGVDLILGTTSADDYIIEINPRLTTSYVGLRVLADFNLAEAMLGVIQGGKLPTMQWQARTIHFQADGSVHDLEPRQK